MGVVDQSCVLVLDQLGHSAFRHFLVLLLPNFGFSFIPLECRIHVGKFILKATL